MTLQWTRVVSGLWATVFLAVLSGCGGPHGPCTYPCHLSDHGREADIPRPDTPEPPESGDDLMAVSKALAPSPQASASPATSPDLKLYYTDPDTGELESITLQLEKSESDGYQAPILLIPPTVLRSPTVEMQIVVGGTNPTDPPISVWVPLQFSQTSGVPGLQIKN